VSPEQERVQGELLARVQGRRAALAAGGMLRLHERCPSSTPVALSRPPARRAAGATRGGRGNQRDRARRRRHRWCSRALWCVEGAEPVTRTLSLTVSRTHHTRRQSRQSGGAADTRLWRPGYLGNTRRDGGVDNESGRAVPDRVAFVAA